MHARLEFSGETDRRNTILLGWLVQIGDDFFTRADGAACFQAI